MGNRSRKKHPIITIISAFIWFLIFLPSIKFFFTEHIIPSNEHTLFEETESDLDELIRKEDAVFPDEFIAFTSNWESYSTEWTSKWHVFKPYLYNSVSELKNLDTSILYKPTGKKSKKKEISPEDFWAQIYTIIVSNNKDRINNLTLAFYWFQEKNELSDSETLQIIIDFIQQIPYEIPENDFGIYTPSEVLYRNAGDCDSKSILAALLLKQLGYETALFYSKEYRHVMLGINTPSTGESMELGGKTYYFTEMTSPGWQIGEISPDCADLNYWYIIAI